jgi:seryl-tRNA synthetase
MDEKTFINGLFIREKEFDNGGSIIKIDVEVNSLTNQLNELKNEKGFVSIDIKKRMNKSDNGLTHYAELNTFIPKTQTQKNQQGQQIKSDDIPF